MNDPGFFSDLTVTQVAAVVGFFTPLLVAFITRSTASTVVKAVMGAVGVAVAALVGALTGADAPESVTIGFVISVVLPALTSHAASYYSLWKPTGIAPTVNERTPGFVG